MIRPGVKERRPFPRKADLGRCLGIRSLARAKGGSAGTPLPWGLTMSLVVQRASRPGRVSRATLWCGGDQLICRSELAATVSSKARPLTKNSKRYRIDSSPSERSTRAKQKQRLSGMNDNDWGDVV